MDINIENIRKVLSGLTHPATGKDIISSGLIGKLHLEGNKLEIGLEMKQTDPAINSLKRECTDELKKAFGEKIYVEYVQANQERAEKKLLDAKNIVAVASGKGGVGKSTVAVNLAVALANKGLKVGLLDADIFGPSIPKMLGIEDRRPEVVKAGNKDVILPVEKFGLKALSIGFFVDVESPLVWRGPMASGAFKQLIHDAEWGGLDYLLIDLPPGTSDIHLTLVQELAVTGAVIVSTPQDVALADAVKGINMFRGDKINVPVLGLVENMAWFTPEELPDNKYYIFGREGCKTLAGKMNIPLLGQVPIVMGLREGGDLGIPAAADPDSITGKTFMEAADKTMKAVDERNQNQSPTQKVNVK